jgi:DNA-binding NarL/FixJ family response regulator
MHILIADDQPRVCSAVRLLLEQQPEVEKVEEAVSAQKLLDCAINHMPDLIFLDWELPGRRPKELITDMRCLCPDIYVIVMDSKPQTRQAALDAGANAFVSKTEPPERLLDAVRSYIDFKINILGIINRMKRREDA